MYDAVLLPQTIAIGVGATFVMDLWGLLLYRCAGIPMLNFSLVGRWIAYMSKGVFHHTSIKHTRPVNKELLIGWVAHYLIGILFAIVFIAYEGGEWLTSPHAVPAVIFGLLTVVFPFLLMQPGMGLGYAASKAPKPYLARLRSIVTHLVFGMGLYITALIMSVFM